MMTFLAWYTFVFMIVAIILSVGDSNSKSGIRIGSLLVNVPILLFAAFYIFS